MATVWKHKYIRSGSIVFGTTKYDCKEDGCLEPQPNAADAAAMASHPSYFEGEVAKKPVAAAPSPKPKSSAPKAAHSPKKRSRSRKTSK